MATGLPTVTVEIEFESGVFTDVTDRVDQAVEPIRIEQGRSSSVDTIQPGTLSLTLDNSDGALTPDNPLSTYYPNVTEGKWIRVTVEKGAVTSVRFYGQITGITPSFPFSASESRVQVVAVDPLGNLERRVLRPLVWEFCTYDVLVTAYFPLTDPEGSTRALPPVGSPGSGLRSLETRGTGAVDFAAATGVGTDGASSVTLNPLANLVGSGSVGCDTLAFFFSASEGATGTVCYVDFAGTDGIFSLYLDTDGYLRPTRVAHSNSVFDGTVAYGPKLTDGGVHFIRWSETDVSPSRTFTLYIDEVEVASTPYSMFDSETRATDAVYLGRPLAGTFSYSHLALAAGGDLAPMYWLTRPSAGTLTQDYLVDALSVWTRQTITSTAVNRILVPFPSDGLSALEAVQRIANNEAGVIYVDPATAEVQILAASDCYPSTSALSISVEDDAVGAVDFARSNAAVVRYVTASNGAAEVTVVDDDATVDATAGVDACTADLTELEGVASRRLAAGKYQTLRPARVVLDLATATTNHYAAALTLFPSSRVTLTDLPSTHFGLSEMDGFVEGWVEELDLTGYRIALDLSSAVRDSAGVFDTSRFGFGPGVCTCSAIDADDTSVTLTWTGAALSTNSGDYPLDLDINGERVTVSSAPGAGTSPRTVTITRGVAPTVARAHAAGEPVELWDVDRFH